MVSSISWNHRWIREHDSSIPWRRTIHRRSTLFRRERKGTRISSFFFFLYVYFLWLKIIRALTDLTFAREKREKKERRPRDVQMSQRESPCETWQTFRAKVARCRPLWKSRYPRASIGQLSNMHTMLRIPYVHPRAKLQCRVISGKTLRPCATLIYHFEVGERKRNVVVVVVWKSRLSFSCLIYPYRSPRGVNRGSRDLSSRNVHVSERGGKIGEKITFIIPIMRIIRSVVERIRE